MPADHPLARHPPSRRRGARWHEPHARGALRRGGRPSIAPELLLRAQLVQFLYAIPSERRLCEHLEYNLLLRWFVGLPLDQPVFHPTSFTKNRRRLLTSEVAEAFFAQIRDQAEAHQLLSREHFSVDGTLLEAAASLKSLRPLAAGRAPAAGGTLNPDVDFHGQRRGNPRTAPPPTPG